MYYLEVFGLLNQLGVRYLLVGGVAVVLHGVVRLTADLDLMIDLKRENIVKFLGAVEKLGYKPKLPVNPMDFADDGTRRKWVKKKNMKVFSFIHQTEEYKLIDVFAKEPLPFAGAYKRKQIVKAGRIDINVVSFDDLIRLKRMAAREQDLKDIAMLEELREKA